MWKQKIPVATAKYKSNVISSLSASRGSKVFVLCTFGSQQLVWMSFIALQGVIAIVFEFYPQAGDPYFPSMRSIVFLLLFISENSIQESWWLRDLSCGEKDRKRRLDRRFALSYLWKNKARIFRWILLVWNQKTLKRLNVGRRNVKSLLCPPLLRLSLCLWLTRLHFHMNESLLLLIWTNCCCPFRRIAIFTYLITTK